MMLLPYPISTNRYWRTFRGRTVRSAEAVAYKNVVNDIAGECMTSPYLGCVAVKLVLHPPKPLDAERRARKDPLWFLSVRRIDLDNALKVCLDALQGIAYVSDRQITSLTIRLGLPIPRGGLSVSIRADAELEHPA